MGCQIGRVVIVNNAGTIIFGDVATINIKIITTSTTGADGSTCESSTVMSAAPSQNARNASESGTVSAKALKKHQRKKK